VEPGGAGSAASAARFIASKWAKASVVRPSRSYRLASSWWRRIGLIVSGTACASASAASNLPSRRRAQALRKWASAAEPGVRGFGRQRRELGDTVEVLEQQPSSSHAPRAVGSSSIAALKARSAAARSPAAPSARPSSVWTLASSPAIAAQVLQHCPPFLAAVGAGKRFGQVEDDLDPPRL
jgi:hypothetical protein